MPTEHNNRRQVSIRDLSAADEPALRAMFGRLSGDTIYKRFHMPFPRVPEPMLAHLMGHAEEPVASWRSPGVGSSATPCTPGNPAGGGGDCPRRRRRLAVRGDR